MKINQKIEFGNKRNYIVDNHKKEVFKRLTGKTTISKQDLKDLKELSKDLKIELVNTL